MLINVKLKGIHIHHVVVQELADGTPVTDALIEESHLDKLKALGIVDWAEPDGEEKLPAVYKNSKGTPLHVWAGFEPRPKHVQKLIEPSDEKPKP